MPPVRPIKGPLGGATFTVTAFLCQNCGHWNKLKTTKKTT